MQEKPANFVKISEIGKFVENMRAFGWNVKTMMPILYSHRWGTDEHG
jgi:hypothetical protein